MYPKGERQNGVKTAKLKFSFGHLHKIHITMQSSFLAATKGFNISPKDFSLVEQPGGGPFCVFVFGATVSPNWNLRFRVRVARFRPAMSELNWMGRG